VDSLLGADSAGDDLQTTLEPRAQQVAVDALRGPQGRAWSRSTSRPARVLVMAPSRASTPTGSTRRHVPAAADRRGELAAAQPRDQATYPPGSTMKVVTATAALDSGRYRRSRASAAATARRSRACRSTTSATRTSATST
jgi:peptidoglycan glycosyltransferase